MNLIQISILTLLICILVTESSGKSNLQLNELNKEKLLIENFSYFIVEMFKKYITSSKVITTIIIPANRSETMTRVAENLVNSLAEICSVKTVDSYCCDDIGQWEYLGGSELFASLNMEPLPDVYILPMNPSRSLNHFESQLEYFERDPSFNQKASFILPQILEKCERQSPRQIMKILNKMWSRNLYRSLLVTCYTCDGTVTIISAKPFSRENVCRQVQHYDVKHSKLTANLDRNNLLDFSYKMPKSFNNCLFWAGTTPSPPYVIGTQVLIGGEIHYKYNYGVDIALMQLTAKKLNFTYDFYKTISYDPTAWFLHLPNNTIVGILQDAIDKKIDVAFGGVVPSYITYYKYDYTPSYKFSAICWYIPSGNVPAWKILFLVYPLNVWILSAITFLLVSTLYSIMMSFTVKHKKKNFYLVKCGNIFLQVFSIGFGISSSLFPKQVSLRILLLAWMIYSMNWNIIYQTVLLTLLSEPPTEKEINSLEDIKQSEFKIKTAKLYIDFFKYFDGLTNSIMRNYIICDNMTSCIREFVQNRDTIIMEKIENMEYLVNLKVSKIHRVEENVVSYSVSFLFNKGNPLTEEFSKILLQCFQAGLLQKWEEVIGWFYHDLKNRDIQSESDSIPLNLHDLAGALSLLNLGLCLSLVAFICEVLFSKLMKTSGQKK